MPILRTLSVAAGPPASCDTPLICSTLSTSPHSAPGLRHDNRCRRTPGPGAPCAAPGPRRQPEDLCHHRALDFFSSPSDAQLQVLLQAACARQCLTDFQRRVSAPAKRGRKAFTTFVCLLHPNLAPPRRALLPPLLLPLPLPPLAAAPLPPRPSLLPCLLL